MKSITDKPIQKLEDDLLRVERYSKALTNFIKTSDTIIPNSPNIAKSKKEV